MRYMFLRFPEGKSKAVTLSYDDGVRADLKLAEILDKYGIKATFNINSDYIGANPGKLTADEIREHLLDKGHEVAVHGAKHIAPGIGKPITVITDVLNCRLTLEKTFDRFIRGMAYPDSGITRMYGDNTYATVREYLKDLGIVYARTLGGDNNSFTLPSDFFAWMPTAHHNNPNLKEWTKQFVERNANDRYSAARYPTLFYLWGHSYEFDNNQNWNVIEEFCTEIGNKEDTWYATNIDIYEYVTAYNALIISADSSKIYNPTLKTVWVDIDGKGYCIASNETLTLA